MTLDNLALNLVHRPIFRVIDNSTGNAAAHAAWNCFDPQTGLSYDVAAEILDAVDPQEDS